MQAKALVKHFKFPRLDTIFETHLSSLSSKVIENEIGDKSHIVADATGKSDEEEQVSVGFYSFEDYQKETRL